MIKKKGGINYKLEKKLPNVTQSWFPTVPNRFLSASLNKLHCIAGPQPSRNPKNMQTNSTQLNSTQLNSTQRLILEGLPKIFPNPTSRALPGRHIFASQLAKGKSFIASGAILRSISTHGNLQQNSTPSPWLDHMWFTLKMGKKSQQQKSGEFQPWKSSWNFRGFQPFQPLNFGRVGAVETPKKKTHTPFFCWLMGCVFPS